METTFEEEYWSNGKPRYKFQYLNGKRHGAQVGYRKNGEISYKVYHINGKGVSGEEWIEYQHKLKTQSLTDMYV